MIDPVYGFKIKKIKR